MRVLEQCQSCTGPEVQAQINALRQAFSKDATQPFELKESLGMPSPTLTYHALPDASAHRTAQPVQPGIDHGWAHITSTMPAESAALPAAYHQPPVSSASSTMPVTSSVGSYNPLPDTSTATTTYTTPAFANATASAYDQHYSLERLSSNEQQQAPAPAWDPSGIFNQWNNAFGNPPPPSQPSAPDPRYTQPSSTAALLPTPLPQVSPLNDATGMSGNFFQHALGGATGLPQPQMPADNVYPTYPTVQTVTSDMWQDAFTSAYVSGHGQKRYRDDAQDASGDYDAYGQKRRG